MSELGPAGLVPTGTRQVWVVADSTVPAADRALLRHPPAPVDDPHPRSFLYGLGWRELALAWLLFGVMVALLHLFDVDAGLTYVLVCGAMLTMAPPSAALAIQLLEPSPIADADKRNRARRRRDRALARTRGHWTSVAVPLDDPLTEVLAAVERVESYRAVREHVVGQDLVAAILDEAHLLAAAYRDVDAMDRGAGDPLRQRAAAAVTARGGALLTACRSVDDVDRVLAEQDTAYAVRAAEDRDLQLLARLEGTPLDAIEHGAATTGEWTASMRRSLAAAQESIGQLPTAGGER